MRRTVPSSQPAHAVRVPDIRKVASEWRARHRGLEAGEVLDVCEALWATRSREERIVAIANIRSHRGIMALVEWPLVERWSDDIDNWEQVDHLADVTGRMLIARPKLLEDVREMSHSENPWQRRLSLVTLIVAFMKGDGRVGGELVAMSDRLAKDPHPLVRRAVVWARDRLKKDHLTTNEGKENA